MAVDAHRWWMPSDCEEVFTDGSMTSVDAQCPLLLPVTADAEVVVYLSLTLPLFVLFMNIVLCYSNDTVDHRDMRSVFTEHDVMVSIETQCPHCPSCNASSFACEHSLPSHCCCRPLVREPSHYLYTPARDPAVCRTSILCSMCTSCIGHHGEWGQVCTVTVLAFFTQPVITLSNHDVQLSLFATCGSVTLDV
ncbi:hypothetical protein BKA93DRAFT_759753 [Sparassis latifolia]